MDPGQTALLIPFVAIVGGLGIAVIKLLINASERRFELKIRLKEAGAIQPDDASTKSLRDELKAFKDTSTQYDLSLDHTLRRIEDRLSFLEQKSAAPRPVAAEEERRQVIGRSD